jgi:hypothetical protein
MITLKAEPKGIYYGSNGSQSLSATQRDLVDILTNLWNNQDRLTKEDLKHLEYLTKK